MNFSRIIYALSILLIAFSLMSCSPVGPDIQEEQKQEENQTEEIGDKKEIKMKMKVGEYIFDVNYADNKTAAAFQAMLPATLKMVELNSNEKYCYISGSLPTSASNPGTINAGDIMLFGNNCVVVFYETFQTSYSYTRIGRIKDTSNLKKAFGSADVSVTFE